MRGDAVGCKMADDRRFVERFDAQAQVVEVAALVASRRAAELYGMNASLTTGSRA